MCPDGFGILIAFLRAARQFVIDLIGADDEKGEDGREGTDKYEKKMLRLEIK